MKKIGELEGKPIVTNEYAPSRGDVIWKDPSDEKFKEAIDGEWIDSPKISSGGGDNFPYEYQEINFDVLIKAEDWVIEDVEDDHYTVSVDISFNEEDVISKLEDSELILGKCNNASFFDPYSVCFRMLVNNMESELSITDNSTSIYGISLYGEGKDFIPNDCKLEFRTLIYAKY